jgi:hypothetical protein
MLSPPESDTDRMIGRLFTKTFPRSRADLAVQLSVQEGDTGIEPVTSSYQCRFRSPPQY